MKEESTLRVEERKKKKQAVWKRKKERSGAR